jgi:hypothetical protein
MTPSTAAKTKPACIALIALVLFCGCEAPLSSPEYAIGDRVTASTNATQVGVVTSMYWAPRTDVWVYTVHTNGQDFRVTETELMLVLSMGRTAEPAE